MRLDPIKSVSNSSLCAAKNRNFCETPPSISGNGRIACKPTQVIRNAAAQMAELVSRRDDSLGGCRFARRWRFNMNLRNGLANWHGLFPVALTTHDSTLI